MKSKLILITTAAILVNAISAIAQSWNLAGNAATDPNTQFIGTTDSKALKFRTNNNVRMTITSGGSIGIGTASPTEAKLVTQGMVGNTMALFGKNVNGISLVANIPTIGFNSYYNGGWKAIQPGYCSYIDLNPGDGKISLNTTTNAVTAGDVITGTQRLSISNTGDVTVHNGRLFLFNGSNGMSSDGTNFEAHAYRPLIGTSTPGDLALQVSTSNLGQTFVAGNVGIGTTAPETKLHVFKGSAGTMTGNTSGAMIVEHSSHNYINIIAPEWAEKGIVFGGPLDANDGGIIYQGASDLLLFRTNGNVNRMTINGNGDVGIGTVSPGYRLDVCGTIRAKEVRVSTGWCDYVFADDYKLPSLTEVEKFIKENKHLPGIAPASEVETEGGLKVGEMMAGMMKKIEELTLYTIEQQKQIVSLAAEVEKLKKN